MPNTGSQLIVRSETHFIYELPVQNLQGKGECQYRAQCNEHIKIAPILTQAGIEREP